MKIQFLGCGLANQIRMYIFVRYAERTHPEQEWYYDNSRFYINDFPTEKYQLEKVFGLKLNMLSDYFDGVTWEKIIQRRKEGDCTAQILSDMGMPIVLVDDWPSYGSFDGTVIDVRAFDPSVIDLPYENIYYYGFWSGKKCFQAFEEENRKELSFPEMTDEKNKEYADKINSSMSVGIHVRRGDFVPLGRDVPIEWYKPEIERVLDEHPDSRFFIFSDDLPWCRANAEALGFNLPKQQTIYVSGNTGEKSYIDMQLLSMCKGMIRSRDSSFSQVAGWLNRNLEFEIRFKTIQEHDRNIIAKEFRNEKKILKKYYSELQVKYFVLFLG